MFQSQTKTPAEEILEKELTTPPSAVPGSTSNEAVEKWLKKHQSQFRGKASAFKKHVADVVSVFQASEATKQDLAETAVKYGFSMLWVNVALYSRNKKNRTDEP